MAVRICLLPAAIGEITAQASASHQITRADQYGLLAAMLADSLDDEERAAVDRLLRAIVRGRFTVSSTLSSLDS